MIFANSMFHLVEKKHLCQDSLEARLNSGPGVLASTLLELQVFPFISASRHSPQHFSSFDRCIVSFGCVSPVARAVATGKNLPPREGFLRNKKNSAPTKKTSTCDSQLFFGVTEIRYIMSGVL